MNIHIPNLYIHVACKYNMYIYERVLIKKERYMYQMYNTLVLVSVLTFDDTFNLCFYDNRHQLMRLEFVNADRYSYHTTYLDRKDFSR